MMVGIMKHILAGKKETVKVFFFSCLSLLIINLILLCPNLKMVSVLVSFSEYF